MRGKSVKGAGRAGPGQVLLLVVSEGGAAAVGAGPLCGLGKGTRRCLPFYRCDSRTLSLRIRSSSPLLRLFRFRDRKKKLFLASSALAFLVIVIGEEDDGRLERGVGIAAEGDLFCRLGVSPLCSQKVSPKELPVDRRSSGGREGQRMEEPQRRRRTMLSDQLSSEAAAERHSPASASIAAASSNNLRNLLTVRQEEDLQPLYQRRGSASVSLGTVIACEKRDHSIPGIPASSSPPAGSSRTLLDIIRDEESVGGGGRFFDDGFIIRSGSSGHNISWRAFKDRLRIRRASTAWQSPGAAGGGGDIPVSGHVLPPPAPLSRNATHDGALPEPNRPSAPSASVESLRPPTPAPIMGLYCAAPSAAEPEQGGPNNQGGVPAPVLATYGEGPPPHPTSPQTQQIRVSLMALLEQTDRQMEGPGFAVSALLEAAGEAEAEEEEEEEEEGPGGDGGGKMYKCCVCMVRHKGAAFIPCGHTFCRLCSRELWVSRGNCPLCNGFILEILDIF
ncbi:hypothetical protein Taro_051680 [Colocasia esculenta]|uniref:RING-type domain-containing protein n=1 Tax=Colocasia esculenta TaxID=4460 RepID=A0A843XHG9_COLES|nr:hypothetical protein [Colocasia esculenta]